MQNIYINKICSFIGRNTTYALSTAQKIDKRLALRIAAIACPVIGAAFLAFFAAKALNSWCFKPRTAKGDAETRNPPEMAREEANSEGPRKTDDHGRSFVDVTNLQGLTEANEEANSEGPSETDSDNGYHEVDYYDALTPESVFEANKEDPSIYLDKEAISWLFDTTSQLKPTFIEQAAHKKIKTLSSEDRDTLNRWTPIRHKKSRHEFDHKNAEILNQLLRFLVLCYFDPEKGGALNPYETLKSHLTFCELELIDLILNIASDDPMDTSATNQGLRCQFNKLLSRLADDADYKSQLETCQNLRPEEVKTEAPLVFFAHALAWGTYLEIDLNPFQDKWIKKLCPKRSEKALFAERFDEDRTTVDTNAKSKTLPVEKAYIDYEKAKGEGFYSTLVPLAKGRVAGSLIYNWMSAPPLTDWFGPNDENNVIQRLWTEIYTLEGTTKKVACIAQAVPTEDTSGSTAKINGHLRLLLDHFKMNQKVFMSFMHLKIADATTGSVNWAGAEGMRAKAQQKLSEKDYPGTYFYMSIPLDGALFTEPHRVKSTEKAPIYIENEGTRDEPSYAIDREGDPTCHDGLKQAWKKAVMNNQHGWYFPHEQITRQFGEEIIEWHDLKASTAPVRPCAKEEALDRLFDKIFEDVKNTFFPRQNMLTKEEWRVFHVLLGVGIIESLSPFSDAFHNTCKDAIDRAAVFLAVRRYLHLVRTQKQEDDQALWDLIVDYVKRAVAAKEQAPLVHTDKQDRHIVAKNTIERIEKWTETSVDAICQMSRHIPTLVRKQLMTPSFDSEFTLI